MCLIQEPPKLSLMRRLEPWLLVVAVGALIAMKAAVVMLLFRIGIVNGALLAGALYVFVKLVWHLPTNAADLHAAEERLLATVGKGIEWERRTVATADGVHINSVHFKTQSRTGANPLVMVHGMGAGLGVWIKTIPELGQHYSDIWCVDLLGFGRSSNPAYNGETAQDALDWWVTTLHEWAAVSLEGKVFDMVGHSLGSYVATAYAIQHPGAVGKLVLAAPIGMVSIEENMKRVSKVLRGVVWLIHRLRLTRSKVMRSLGPAARFVIEGVLKKRVLWYGYDSTELREYVFHLQVAPTTGEDAMLSVFCPRVGWSLCLLPAFPLLQVSSVTVILGAHDFVPHSTGTTIKRSCSVPTNVVCLDTGHHMHTAEPALFCTHVLA